MTESRVPRALGALLLTAWLGSCTEGARNTEDPPAGSTSASEVASVPDTSNATAASHFIREALLADVKVEERPLSDGTRAECYVIVSRARPHEHEMGPWSPRHVTDGKDKGGVWMKDGVLYDVDGPFIAGLADPYSDPEWNLVREDGSIRVTETKQAFEAAARPDVDPRYHNHVVEGRPEWLETEETTYVIPVKPIRRETPTRLMHGAVGVAFNGVGYDPPAPLHAIIAAHTIAPLDDGGGHLNPHAGYHYHAATGRTKEIAQPDGNAPMIGYALDGYAIYAHLDANGREAEGVDECGGHTDVVRGYHHHAGAPGSNQIIRAFRGVPGTSRTSGPAGDAHRPPDGRRPGPPPGTGRGEAGGR